MRRKKSSTWKKTTIGVRLDCLIEKLLGEVSRDHLHRLHAQVNPFDCATLCVASSGFLVVDNNQFHPAPPPGGGL